MTMWDWRVNQSRSQNLSDIFTYERFFFLLKYFPSSNENFYFDGALMDTYEKVVPY